MFTANHNRSINRGQDSLVVWVLEPQLKGSGYEPQCPQSTCGQDEQDALTSNLCQSL